MQKINVNISQIKNAIETNVKNVTSNIDVSIKEQKTQNKNFIETNVKNVTSNINVSIDKTINNNGDCFHDEYKGTYEITPKANETQVLETKNKLLNDNVKINKIPYYEVSNNENGKTVIIA